MTSGWTWSGLRSKQGRAAGGGCRRASGVGFLHVTLSPRASASPLADPTVWPGSMVLNRGRGRFCRQRTFGGVWGDLCLSQFWEGGAWRPAGGDRVALTSLPFAGLGVSAAPGCTSVTPASFRPPAQGYPGTCFFLRGHPVTSRMRVHLSARWDRCGRTAVPRLTQALGVGATEPQPAPPP